MAQQPKVTIQGLYTNASDIAGAPQGGLLQAKNIDISKMNVAQCRRGFDLLNAFPSSSYRATKIWDYQNYLYAYFDTAVYNYISGTWTSRGSLTKPTNALVPRPVFSNNNLYITSNAGLKKIDAYTSSLISAGMPSVVQSILTEVTGTGTAVENGKTANYRAVIVKRDANNNLVQGPVSNGTSYSNAAGHDHDIGYLGYLPTGLLGTESVQVYRSAGLTTPAVSDECQMCYEYPLNSSNVAASAKTFLPAEVNTGTDVITISSHGFQDGTVLQFTNSGGGLPAGLSLATNYIVYASTTNTFKLYATDKSSVNITTQGTGTHTATSQVAFCFFDVVPDGLLGATIYTAPSQNGISQSNTQPPLACDIALYKDFLFFADTQSKHRFTFSLLTTGTNGLSLADTITISGEVYTAAAAASYGSGSGSFKLDTTAGATGIDATARSLVDVINRSSALVTATLLYTDSSSLPGRILLEGKSLGSSSFTVASSRQGAFSPQLPSTATSLTTSTSDTYRNGLMYSRQGLPEAVPALNLFRVGSADDPILRIIALRDALLIFKRKDGTYVLRGENPGSFSVQLLDSTAKLVAAETAVVVNGLIYGMFESGICSVSDTSVQVIGEAVKDKIQTYFGQCFDQLKQYSFGIAYEADNKYILSVPTSDADTSSVYQIVFDVGNGTFVEWDLEICSGYASSINQKLYVGSGDSPYIKQERKAFDETDHCDYAGQVEITSYSGTTLVISGGVDAFSIGDLLSQGTDEADAYVTAVNNSDSSVTVDFARTWTTGTTDVDHYQGIECIIQWLPFWGDNPAGLKHFSEVAMLFKQALIRGADIGFISDTTPALSTVEVSGDSSGSAWGVGTWGTMPWGGVSNPDPIRIGVPRDVARCNALTVIMTHKIAQSDWQLEGIVPVFYPTSTRVSR